jgi:hypothetical protein
VAREGAATAEQCWTSGACGAAVELEETLCGGVSGTALGKEPGGDTNAVGEVATQGEGFRRGKGPRCSGLEAAGLKRDGLVAEGSQVDCSWEEAAGAVWERGRGREAGEKRRPGCPRSLPSVCTCNMKNRVISDTWR